jgi:hypothetical protein
MHVLGQIQQAGMAGEFLLLCLEEVPRSAIPQQITKVPSIFTHDRQLLTDQAVMNFVNFMASIHRRSTTQTDEPTTQTDNMTFVPQSPYMALEGSGEDHHGSTWTAVGADTPPPSSFQVIEDRASRQSPSMESLLAQRQADLSQHMPVMKRL